MSLHNVENREQLEELLARVNGPAVLGFFGDFSDSSVKALPEFERFCAEHADQEAFLVDVKKTKTIHAEFGVTVVPTVLLIDGKTIRGKVVGAQSAAYYARTLSPGQRTAVKPRQEQARAKRVVVYTGPSCVWCTRVKNYLRSRGVRFEEVDVSRNETAARSLIHRTGQTGVPQLDIEGQYVVGFDKTRIDRLLGLENEQAEA